MDIINNLLNRIMDFCYLLCDNYGLAIILFTFITKVILLPLSLWTYCNGITLVKIQPDVNYIKCRYYGQPDQIAEEQAKLFKESGYHPLLSVIPTLVQFFLLIAVVGVIRQGINNPSIDMRFGSINLGDIPSEKGLSLVWSPITAGLASFVLCFAQNKSNVLQVEQSKLNKYGFTISSVGLSLYLGWFVAVGTAFYWICSNLMAVLQLYILNWFFKPDRFVDHKRLEDSRKQLKDLKEIGKSKKRESFFSENRKRERADYKRFFSVVNKHLVFYSENNGFYKYYKGIIEYLLENTNLTIHYITSDPDDSIFKMAEENPRIRGYYIGENKLITLMMKMDADVVCMTMPDLGNYHIKRSYVKDDIEYVYIPHGTGSFNMVMRKGCIDHYDTFFAVTAYQIKETRKTEEIYNLKPKKIVEFGYPLMDDMRNDYLRNKESIEKPHSRYMIVIAPSWQRDNIVDLCLDEMLDRLKDDRFEIIVRPHPQAVRHKREFFEELQLKYAKDEIKFQLDFADHKSLFESDIVITDWSGAGSEFAYATLKPVIYINTPPKIMNPDYKEIGIEPIDFIVRDVIGKSINLENIDDIKSVVLEVLHNKDQYRDAIEESKRRYFFNIGSSAEVGAKYLISTLQEKTEKRKNGTR